jgi:hypothetical protein
MDRRRSQILGAILLAAAMLLYACVLYYFRLA